MSLLLQVNDSGMAQMTLYLACGNKVVKCTEYSYLLINYSFEGTCK